MRCPLSISCGATPGDLHGKMKLSYDQARKLNLPHVYLGYYVEGCPSMSYKPLFVPNQILGSDGLWHDFRC